MAKKEGHAYHKPKPRVAVYAGLVGSGLVAAGETGDMPYELLGNIKYHAGLKAAAGNLAAIATDYGTAAKVATPAIVGVVVSIGADKLGVNKVLAKMKMPFRV